MLWGIYFADQQLLEHKGWLGQGNITETIMW